MNGSQRQLDGHMVQFRLFGRDLQPKLFGRTVRKLIPGVLRPGYYRTLHLGRGEPPIIFVDLSQRIIRTESKDTFSERPFVSEETYRGCLEALLEALAKLQPGDTRPEEVESIMKRMLYDLRTRLDRDYKLLLYYFFGFCKLLDQQLLSASGRVRKAFSVFVIDNAPYFDAELPLAYSFQIIDLLPREAMKEALDILLKHMCLSHLQKVYDSHGRIKLHLTGLPSAEIERLIRKTNMSYYFRRATDTQAQSGPHHTPLSYELPLTSQFQNLSLNRHTEDNFGDVETPGSPARNLGGSRRGPSSHRPQPSHPSYDSSSSNDGYSVHGVEGDEISILSTHMPLGRPRGPSSYQSEPHFSRRRRR